MKPIRELYDTLRKAIIVHTPEEADQIAFIILSSYYYISRTDLFLNQEVDETYLPNNLVTRINAYEPIQYVLGQTEFCGNVIRVNPDVLIPRPETEELVGYVLNAAPKKVLDLATGSGCIAISIAKANPDSEVIGIDISQKALDLASLNGYLNERKNLKFEKADILNFDPSFDFQFDALVSNPPYVLEAEKASIEKHVLEFEPHLALFVPDNCPLLFYKKIVEIALKYLKPSGKIFLEINAAFGAETLALFENSNFKNAVIEKDFNGKDRFVFAERI
jgi:release factor glutamine methyltransferase